MVAIGVCGSRVQRVVAEGRIAGNRGASWRRESDPERFERTGKMQQNQLRKVSVAPMMDWTDRHCRVFHRRLSRRTLLYTEMTTARALLHGDPDQLLRHAAEERPLALQLGGSVPG